MSENHHISDLSLSELLRLYLSEEGCPQVSLSKASGVSEGLISRLLSGDRTSISSATAQKLSRVLGVSPEDIMSCAKNQPDRNDLRAIFNNSFRSNVEVKIRTRFAHPFALQNHFTGRQKERKEMVKWFSENIYPVLVIYGPLGQGATSLAWICVQQDFLKIPIPGTDDDLDHPYLVSAGNYIEVVFWWSFKEPQADFSSFLSEAIKFISQHDIAPVDTNVNRKVDILIALLQEHRTLLVLDSFEMVSYRHKRENTTNEKEDKNSFDLCYDNGYVAQEPSDRFLGELTAIPNSKTLITTHLVPYRLRRLAGCKIKILEALLEKDSVRFLKRLGLTDSDSQLATYVREYKGNPLDLRLFSERRIRSQLISDVP